MIQILHAVSGFNLNALVAPQKVSGTGHKPIIVDDSFRLSVRRVVPGAPRRLSKYYYLHHRVPPSRYVHFNATTTSFGFSARLRATGTFLSEKQELQKDIF